MHVSRSAFLVAAFLGLIACGNKNDDDAPPPIAPSAPPSIAPVAEQPAPAPTPMKVEEPKAKIEPRVKAELDGRADGITGTPLAVAGAKASLQAPAGWQTTKGAFTVAASADKKAQLAAGALAAADSASSKLPDAVSALGLSSCEWGPTESVSVGKTKLAASAADGLCMRGATQVRTAYVAPQAEGLLVVGAWEPAGDAGGVFGAMRSIAKAAGGDASGIAACCSALRQNANSAPPEQKGFYISAAAVCDGLKNDPQGRAVLGQVRALLMGANVPATCR